jgi:hypothetical protein
MTRLSTFSTSSSLPSVFRADVNVNTDVTQLKNIERAAVRDTVETEFLVIVGNFPYFV